MTVGTLRVEQDEAGLVEQERGAVQVLERTEAAPLPGMLDAGEHRGDQLVEQVYDVVERRGLLDLGEGQEGRVPPRWGHPGDGLRPGQGGIAGQDLDPHGRHGREVDVADPEGTDLPESLERLDHAGDADPRRGAAEPLQGRLPGVLVGDQQRLQAGCLSRLQDTCQGAPQP